MLKTTLLSIAIFLAASYSSSAQKKIDVTAKNKFVMVNRALEVDRKAKSVKLDERLEEGLAKIQDIVLTTGIIEVDLKGKDVLQRSFVGMAFHIQNDSTYEAIYFRPFNFHASDPVRKIHAVQYIAHPTNTWRKLRDERNGEFEKGIDNAPDPNGWFHAKIEITLQEVLVYVNGSTTPSLKVSRLASENTGGIALWVGDGSGGEYKNLTIIAK